jgi:3',5'-cyclic AMP phosphodiesterase CpdA
MVPELPAAPPAPRCRLVIAHLSDLHIGAHLPAAVDTVTADVVAAAPDLTVVTGDCTMRARAGQFRQVQAIVDRLPEPRMVLLGNHDIPLVAVSRLTTPYDRFREHLAADLDPVAELPGLRAVGLQSMPRWRWKGGRVSRRQADLVIDVLGAAPGASVRVVALHHPPFSHRPAGIAGRDRLVRALVRARVDLVLAGHTHRPAARRVRLSSEGVTHQLIEIVAGTATSVRTRGVGRSWTLIRIDDGITIEERHEAGAGWDVSRRLRFARQ